MALMNLKKSKFSSNPKIKQVSIPKQHLIYKDDLVKVYASKERKKNRRNPNQSLEGSKGVSPKEKSVSLKEKGISPKSRHVSLRKMCLRFIIPSLVSNGEN